MKKLSAMMLAGWMMLSSACAETVLRTRNFDNPEAFMEAHPGVRVEVIEGYRKADQLLNMLMTHSMDEDMFSMSTYNTDVANVIDKGFCLDLSGNEGIREAVGRMYPALQELVTRDGGIYGVPFSVTIEAELICNAEVWQEMGYTAADVPKSFPALLDFLESWVVRNEIENLDCSVRGSLDETIYNQYTYPQMLVGWLMDSWTQQKMHAGEPMHFNDPVLIELLERSKKVGSAIYRYCEPSVRVGGRGLFGFSNTALGSTWETINNGLVDMRISEDQPSLIVASGTVLAAYAGTNEPELAAEMVLAELQYWDDPAFCLDSPMRAFIYADAEPVAKLSYEDNVRAARNRIAIAEHRLAGDDTPLEDYLELTEADYVRAKSYEDASRMQSFRVFAAELDKMLDSEVEDKLDELKARLARTEEDKWSLSPEGLATYRRYAQNMIVEKPSFFHSGSDASANYESLVSQYVHDLISVEQLVTQLDRIAQMVEMENQ